MSMKSKKHLETGKKGEAQAVEFLRRSGYKILATNWHYGHKEIDIIAMDQELLVIVEVKTRHSTRFGFPEEAVNKRKQRFLIEAAHAYIMENDIHFGVRYDVIAIVYEGGKRSLIHLKDAFIPGL